MKIDRSNYEAFFILYMDNELSSEERSEVEAFALAHPDLQEELDLLLQSRLLPDESILFENKEELLEIPTSTTHEDLLLHYIDGEVTEEQFLTVNQLAAVNPMVQRQLDLLLKTKAQADASIVFPDKTLLYRREEKRRPLGWWKMAAAAAILAAVATGALFTINRNRQAGSGQELQFASLPAKSGTTQAGTTDTKNSVAASNTGNGEMAANPQQETAAVDRSTQTAGKRDLNLVKNPVAARELQPEKNGIAKATPGEDRQGSPMITVPTQEIRVTTPPSAEEKNIAAAGTRATPQQNSNTPAVTRAVNDTYSNMTASANRDNNVLTANQQDNDELETERSGKKNKLRGFFRKVTRTFEKTTHINATDDDDRLLVGGLAIRLK